jgi:hypothetical protein
MTWLPLAPLDHVLLGVTVCFLLVVIGLARSWSLCHDLRGAQAELDVRLSEQALRLEVLQQRLDRVATVSEAQESDERSRHDEGVVELLGSLLKVNEALRSSSPEAS